VIYREAGDFKSSYAADGQTFPIASDRWVFRAAVAAAFLVVPLVITDYWSNAVLLPFLIWAIAAIGLNILTGYCGQVSLGTGGFMAVGAFASFKLMTAFPEMNVLFAVLGAGVATALVAPPSACHRCGSRASTSPWPRWRRSSSWSGCSTRCRGS
jgi:branched-chain amino acid transport system permease protein